MLLSIEAVNRNGSCCHHADGATQAVEGDAPYVLPVDGDAPAGDVVIAGQQMDDGGLAAAWRADDAEHPPAQDLEGDPVEGERAVLVIGEADILEAQRAFGHRELARVRGIADRRLQIDHREQPRAAGRAPREGIHHQPERAHRELQYGDEGEELGQRPERHRARDHPLAADPEHQPHGDEIGKGHLCGRGDADIDAPRRQKQRLGRRLVVLAQLERLGAEGANHPYAGQVLVHDAAEHRHPVLEQGPQIAQPEPRRRRPPSDIGDEAQAQEPEDRVDGEQQRRADADQHNHLQRAQQPRG